MKRLFVLALAVSLPAAALALSESEPNGAPGFANGPFTPGEALTGNFNNDGEGQIDYFSFNADSGTTYNFTASVTNGSSPGLDLAIAVTNGSGTILSNGGVEKDTNAVGGPGATETLSWVASGTGTFYFYIREATGFTNGIQGYSTSSSSVAAVEDWNLY